MVSEKTAAKEEITKSLRDLLTFNITVPLGNPNYKLVHTNKYITTKLPTDFILDNLLPITPKLSNMKSLGNLVVMYLLVWINL